MAPHCHLCHLPQGCTFFMQLKYVVVELIEAFGLSWFPLLGKILPTFLGFFALHPGNWRWWDRLGRWCCCFADHSGGSWNRGWVHHPLPKGPSVSRNKRKNVFKDLLICGPHHNNLWIWWLWFRSLLKGIFRNELVWVYMGLQIDLFNWIGHWTYDKNCLTEFFQ